MMRLVRVSVVALALLLAVVNMATAQTPDPQVDEAGCTYEIVYTSCSKECGGGTQRQKKIIVDKPADVAECTPYEEVEVACNQQACAFEGAGPEVVVTEENLALAVTDDKDVMFMEHDGEGNRREITTLRKLLKRLDDAESELATVKSQAEDCQSRVTALEAWRPAVDQSVSDMTSDIGDLQQEQSDTASTLSEVSSQVDDNVEKLSELDGDVSSLQGTVGGHSDSVKNYKTRIEALESWKPSVDSSLTSMTSDIGDLQRDRSKTTSDLSDLSSDVSDNTDIIGDIDGDVTSLKTTVGGHSAALSSLQQTVTTLQQAVGTAGAKADSSLDRVNKAELRLDKLGSYSFLSFSRLGNGKYRFVDANDETYEMSIDSSSEDVQRVGQGDKGFAYKLDGPATPALPAFYFSLKGSVSIACTVIGSEDDSINHWHLRYATDGGNGVGSIWGQGGVSTLIVGFQNIDCNDKQPSEECSHPKHLPTYVDYQIFCVSPSPTKP